MNDRLSSLSKPDPRWKRICPRIPWMCLISSLSILVHFVLISFVYRGCLCVDLSLVFSIFWQLCKMHAVRRQNHKLVKSSWKRQNSYHLCHVWPHWDHVCPPQKGLLEVFYDIFQLVVPVATTDFNEALVSVGGYSDITLITSFLFFFFLMSEVISTETVPCSDPSRFQDSWRLSDGFVASEAKTILPHRSCSR